MYNILINIENAVGVKSTAYIVCYFYNRIEYNYLNL